VRAALAHLAFDRLVPDDDEARARRALRLRRIGVKLGAAAVAAVMVLAVFPVRMWVNQRAAEERAREREEVFERENPLLEEEIRDLRTDERIEQEARELGYVLPGEEPYGILPAPEAPAGGTPPSSTTTTTTTRPSG
jgi:cell division protein FtsB